MPGDAGDTFTITVTNSGTTADQRHGDDRHHVADGTDGHSLGWHGLDRRISTLTATRSDSLASDASYSALTLTVDVASGRVGQPHRHDNRRRRRRNQHLRRYRQRHHDHRAHDTAYHRCRAFAQRRHAHRRRHHADRHLQRSHDGAGTASNYELRSVGADGLFNTSDDVLVPLSVSYSNDVATLTFAGLTEGIYRLTVYDTIANGRGTKLDGNDNGTPGGNWVADFVVVPSGTVLGSAATIGLSGTSPLAVATGDFNGDGKLDLVVVDSGTNTAEILLNNGSGTFTVSSSYSLTYTGYYGDAVPYAVTVGDFNGDGKLDFAVANFDQVYGSGTIEVFLGNGTGTFTFGAEYQGTGRGTGFDPISIVAADFNGDGKLDLAVANYYQGLVNVLTGNGNGTFSTTPATYSSGGTDPRALVVADFNADGHPDLAVANYGSSTVGVLLNSGTGTFASAVTYSTGGSNPRSLAVGDLNGDGKPDLVAANYTSGTIGVLLNKGTGTFATVVTYSTGGTYPRGVALADFNGDGHLDVIVTNNGSNTVGVLLNTGTGTFATATTFSTGSGSGPFGVAVGDFNGDGKSDVAVTDNSTNSVAVLLDTYGPSSVSLTTPGGFTFAVAAGTYGTGEFVSGTGSSGIFSGDDNAFNGDGRLYVGGTLLSAARRDLEHRRQRAKPRPQLRNGRRIDRQPRNHRAQHRQPGLRPHRRYLHQFHQFVDYDHGADRRQPRLQRRHDGLRHFRRRHHGRCGRSMDLRRRRRRPAIVIYLHGPLSLQPTSLTLNGDNLQWTYSITVVPGASVNLAYFTIVATTSAAAVAEANALVTGSGFGDQAGAFLSAAELQSLANFANPSPALTPPPSPTEGHRPEQRHPLPFHRHQRQRQHQQLHGHDHLGRRRRLDGDEHAEQRRPDRRRSQRRLRCPGFARLPGSDAKPCHAQCRGQQRRRHDRRQRRQFQRPRRAADGRRLTAPAAIVGSFSDAVVFHFSDANSYATAADYSATITWGDGTTSTVTATAGDGGQIVADANGGFNVLGSHNYTASLSGATFRVQVTDEDGSTTGASTTSFSVAAAVTSAQTASTLDLAGGATLVIAAGGTLTVTGGVEIGSGATLEVQSGGTLNLSSLAQGTGTATLLLAGGTLEAAGTLTSAMPIVIGAGGGTIDTNGYNVTLDGPLSAAASTGTLIKSGAGTLTLSGVSTFTGGTSVLAGALVATSPSAAVQRQPYHRQRRPRGPGRHDCGQPRHAVQYNQRHDNHGNHDNFRYGDEPH